MFKFNKFFKIQLFQNMPGHGWNHECSNMIANILPADPSPHCSLSPHPTHIPPGMGSKGQNSTFSEYAHVAYQIKGNHKCSNMQAHILSLHTPSTPGVGVKGQNIFFSESSHVAYQIRREWSIEHHASTYSVITHPRPLGGVTGQNNFFF